MSFLFKWKNTLPFLSLMGGLLFSCASDDFEMKENANESFHIKNGDYAIPVWVRGNLASKKILLYVQGGPAGNTMDFATVDYPNWKSSLEKDYAIAYYEQRGTGNRQGNFDLGENVMVTYVEDLHAVAQFLAKAYDGVDIIMMGHSFGGGLTLRYMLHYGKQGVPKQYISLDGPVTTDDNEGGLRWQFRRSFLFNSANLEMSRNHNTERWKEVLTWLDAHPVIAKTTGADPFVDMQQWNDYVEELIYNYYGERTLTFSDYLKVFDSPYNPFPAFLRGDDFNGGLGTKILDEEKEYQMIFKLESIDYQSILLVTGRYDDICVPEELEYVYDHITSDKKEIAIIDSAGHEVFTHQPEKLNKIIKDFIQ